MKIKCDFCGAAVDENEKSCPHCGAVLSGVNRSAAEEPKTVDELKAWYEDHNLPPENITRFFIGKDIREARAFGIYKETDGDFVVYKNKSDGSRAIRYKGRDEGYAVNELYQRLKAEIADRKGENAAKRTVPEEPKRSGAKNGRGSGCLVYLFVIFLFLAIFTLTHDNSPSKGYYRYNDRDYYYQNSKWYYYNEDTDDWLYSDTSPDINSDNQSDYSTEFQDGKSFEDSEWYQEGSGSWYQSDDDDDDWDSDSSWDSSDDWDSGSTDWDSDW